ncbi:hypothetical protein XI02_41630 [Bradyrhizobium sp. CCBAU 21365]|nr:hypothetical protein XI02_41630 [Bradyrhizobium sp. CCBAU 21365]
MIVEFKGRFARWSVGNMHFVPLKMGHIGAFWNCDAYRIIPARIHVVAIEVAAQSSSFKTNDRVSLGIERIVAPKHAQGNCVAFQAFSAACKRLVDNETKESLPPFARLEMRTCEDAVQLFRYMRRRHRGIITTRDLGCAADGVVSEGYIRHQPATPIVGRR